MSSISYFNYARSFSFIGPCFLAYLISCFAPALSFGRCIDAHIDLKQGDWRQPKHQTKKDLLKKHESKPTKLTIHFTGVRQVPKTTIQSKLRDLFYYSTRIKNEHKKKLWGDVPYHFYIDVHGKAAEGRSTEYPPDSNTKYQTDGHISIVVEGDDKSPFLPVQQEKLLAMMKALQDDFGIATNQVGIHKAYANTTCPGSAIQAFVEDYRSKQKDFVPDSTRCLAAPL